MSENLNIQIHKLSKLSDDQIKSLVKENKKVNEALSMMQKEKEIEEPQRRSKRIIEKLERKEDNITLKLSLKINVSEINKEKDVVEENLPSIKSFFIEDQKNPTFQNFIKPCIFSKSAFELPKFNPESEVFNVKKRIFRLVKLKSQKRLKWKW